MLEIDNIYYSIGEQIILDGLSLKARSGDRVGIIGPNGSGKTTLFNCLSGFNSPSTGKISFGETEVLKYSPSSRANLGFGRLFQNFGIFREMTVEENILIALESKNTSFLEKLFRSRRKFRPKVEYYLSQIGLEDKINDKAGSLSGGQLRLLEIIRLIAFGAKLFLLDEPTAGVSPKMKSQILKALKNLIPSEAIVLLIEHDINFMQDFCDRVVVLDMGKVVIEGPIGEVRGDSRLQEIYFGSKE